VLAENQKSHQNRPLHADQGTYSYSARANDTKSVYCLALFNAEDMPVSIAFDLSHLNLGDKTAALRDLWTRRGLPAARGIIRQTVKPHGAVLLSLSA
jgi:alpha-galactosidase